MWFRSLQLYLCSQLPIECGNWRGIFIPHRLISLPFPPWLSLHLFLTALSHASLTSPKILEETHFIFIPFEPWNPLSRSRRHRRPKPRSLQAQAPPPPLLSLPRNPSIQVRVSFAILLHLSWIWRFNLDLLILFLCALCSEEGSDCESW